MQASKRYYGWTITKTLAITETISWGIIYYAFTVFITPMEKELGWTRAELTGGFSLALLVMGGMALPVGYWIDRYGARLLMTVGSVAACLLLAAWARVTDIGAFYLIWAGLGACGAAVLYEPAFAVIAAWFVRQRGRALAVITFAAGLASTIFVPLSDLLLRLFGWREAVFLLALFLALTTIAPHALILRRHPADLGLLPDGDTPTPDVPRPAPKAVTLSGALSSRFFWMLTLAFSLSYFAAAAIKIHFIPFLIDTGIDASAAAFASGSIGLMQVTGRLIFAPLESRFSSRMMVIGVFALQALAMMVLLLGTSLWIIGVFIVIFGTSYGAKTLARASIIADLFGASHYGRISSVMTIPLTIASTSAPLGAALIYDHTGSYTLVVWMVVLLALAATGVIAFAKPQPAAAAAQPNAVV